MEGVSTDVRGWVLRTHDTLNLRVQDFQANMTGSAGGFSISTQCGVEATVVIQDHTVTGGQMAASYISYTGAADLTVTNVTVEAEEVGFPVVSVRQVAVCAPPEGHS